MCSAEGHAASGRCLLHSFPVRKCRGASRADRKRVASPRPGPPTLEASQEPAHRHCCLIVRLAFLYPWQPEEEQGSEGFQGRCSRPAWRRASLDRVFLLLRGEEVGFRSREKQPSVSLGLFLAPRPLLKPGYKYRSPPYSPAVCVRASVCEGRGAPSSPRLQPGAGVWASFPTRKKAPVRLGNKYSQAPTSVCWAPCRQELIFQPGLPECAGS